MSDASSATRLDRLVRTPEWNAVRSLTCGHLRAAHNYQSDPTLEWSDEDIRLINAAPKMLAALKAIARIRWGYDGDCGAVAIAESAIIEATE